MIFWIRRLGMAAVVFLVATTLAGAGVYGITGFEMARRYTIEVDPGPVPGEAAGLERGRHVAVVLSKCGDCHGPDLGGMVIVDEPAFGRISATNLTSGEGGIGSKYTDEDYVRAIRHGVSPDGRPLVIMPSHEYYHLSDADLGALIAYLKQLPPVDRELPATRVGPIARVLFAAGRLRELLPVTMIDHDAPRPEPVPEGPTVEYGEYLAMTSGCKGCHGMGLSGRSVPAAPPDFPRSSNLTPAGIGSWTEADFFRALREGRRPDGSLIDPRMPWAATAQMSDDEIRALWLYLQTVPPRETGRG
jgi:mono/diheme cytochrome c family protein